MNNFQTTTQHFTQTYATPQSNAHQYAYIQPNMRQIQPQGLGTVNIRSRKRRTCHSVVATMDPVAVARRNERERNRVKQVNEGFNELRKKIPYIPDKKKFSKVEILRFAMTYIRELQGLIDESNCDDEEKSDETLSLSVVEENLSVIEENMSVIDEHEEDSTSGSID